MDMVVPIWKVRKSKNGECYSALDGVIVNDDTADHVGDDESGSSMEPKIHSKCFSHSPSLHMVHIPPSMMEIVKSHLVLLWSDCLILSGAQVE